MTTRNSLIAMVLAAICLASAPAFAEQNDQAAEASTALSATVTAADAIAAVEKQGSGKVVELTLEGSGAAAFYAITLLATNGTETNYLVDAHTGAIVQTGEAWSDNKQTADRGDGDSETADDGPGQDQGNGDGEDPQN